MTSAFDGVAAVPPEIGTDDVCRLVSEHYEREVTAEPLVSERDSNFLVTAPHGWRGVFKVASGAEGRRVPEAQVAALLHLERADDALPVPRVVPASDGRAMIDVPVDGTWHAAWTVSFLAGSAMSDNGVDVALAREFGATLARLDDALLGFTHRGIDDRQLLWDIRRAPELAALQEHIPDATLRDTVAETFATFADEALPHFSSLPAQVIHNDANPSNVLIDSTQRITGVIDFGDMLHLPRIVEPAVAASYLRTDGDDPLALIGAMLSGYHERLPLLARELALLPLLIRTRLATTVAILHWRHSLRDAGDAYLAAAAAQEDDAATFLARLTRMGDAAVARRLGERIGFR